MGYIGLKWSEKYDIMGISKIRRMAGVFLPATGSIKRTF
jgi:hypothetical protein